MVVAVDEVITVWGLHDQERLASFRLRETMLPDGSSGDFDPTPRSAVLSKDGEVLFALYRQYLAAWTLDGDLLSVFELGYSDRYTSPAALILSPGGSLLAWATVSGVVEVWGVKLQGD